MARRGEVLDQPAGLVGRQGDEVVGTDVTTCAQHLGGGQRTLVVGVGERWRLVVRRCGRHGRVIHPCLPPRGARPGRGRYVLATYHAGRVAALVWCPHRARERAQLMATRRYLNFDLLLEQEGEGRYQARVTDSPLGETPSVRFQLPFDATTLENLLLKLDPGRSGTRRVGGTGQQQAAMDFGGPLYQAVFTGDLALAWQRSLDQVRAEQAGGLRLRLRLNDAPAIAGLPWELLYDARSNNFLAQSERTPLVRFLDVPQVPRPIAVDGPLRVLAIISSPIDLDELDVEAEWSRIQEALEPRTSTGLVVLDRLPSATLSELGTWLRRSETHVVHFIGHGDFDDRDCARASSTSRTRPGGAARSPRRRWARTCATTTPSGWWCSTPAGPARTDTTDPFGGMAQGLVQQDATAVVAMQFPISDRAAVKFTGEFYGALVDGLPVDQAVSSARKALLDGFQRRVGDAGAVPALARRQHLRERARRSRASYRAGALTRNPSRPARCPRSGSPPALFVGRQPAAGAGRCRGSGGRRRGAAGRPATR